MNVKNLHSPNSWCLVVNLWIQNLFSSASRAALEISDIDICAWTNEFSAYAVSDLIMTLIHLLATGGFLFGHAQSSDPGVPKTLLVLEFFLGKFCGEPNSDSAASSACSEPPIRSRLPVSVQVRGGARGLRVTRHGLRVRVVHWTEPAWATVRLHLGSPLAGQGPCLGIDSAKPRPWPAVRLHSTPSSPGRGPTRSQPEAEALLEFRVRTIRNHRAT